ncbi:hypothetical protein ACS3UN_05970 [Oscillospiraceae bacterium LTW-04]|nr:hypothetical protein RBH76_04390 [Oscillospiraceae bacterium MB24-C1]
MADCLKCANAAAYPFRVLEIRTLHVRDITGEKRVQALGELKSYAVCKSCAATHLEKVKNPIATAFKRIVAFGAILALGLIMTVVFQHANSALRLMGFAAIICGVLGLISSAQSTRKHQQLFAGLDTEQALAFSAWEVMLENAPKKSADADLTYIPINEKTLAAKNGDLMILYDLLPEIAVQAHRILHQNNVA